MADNGPLDSNERQKTIPDAIVALLHPIPLTVMVILIGVTLLLAANVLGWDKGPVLSSMGGHEFARGLITYLFAVTTIGTSVVLVLAALLKDVDKEAFARGKEVLGLMLGVFGTIVGFYFGSEAHAAPVLTEELGLGEPILSTPVAASGTTVTITAVVRGGTPPYLYAIGTGPAEELVYDNRVRPDGLIVHPYPAPQVTEPTEIELVIAVRDARNEIFTREVTLTVSAGGAPGS